jgi:hypothetical protein
VLAFSEKSRAKEIAPRKGMNVTRTSDLAGSDQPSLDVRGQGADRLSVRNLRSNSPRPIPPETGELLRMRLVGGSPAANFEGLDPLPGKVNYYIGNDPSRWRAGIPTFAKVRYHRAYPGVDLVYYGKQGQLEYDFEVAPGADPALINLAIADENALTERAQFGGKESRTTREAARRHYRLRIDPQGNLVVRLDRGEVRLRKPVIYQPSDNGTQEPDSKVKPTAVDSASGFRQGKFIEGHYVLRGHHQVGFAISAYDRSRPLIIDPVLAYSAYSMGMGAVGVGLDGSGDAYLLGTTYSGGTFRASVIALNSLGTQVMFTTNFGPLGGSIGPSAVAVDHQGNSYIAGNGATGMPTTQGAFEATCSAVPSCNTPFAAKFSPAGTLDYSTFLGPSNAAAKAIAFDSSGHAYITGTVASNDLPVVNAFQSQMGGGICTSCANAFVQKLNPTGSQFVFSTYFSAGGLGLEVIGTGIAVDASGSAYIVGNGSAVPLRNPLEQGVGGAFLAKFTPDGTALVYSTLLGGSGGAYFSQLTQDTAVAVAVDTSGDAYVTGEAASPDFPLSMNAYKASCNESALEACIAPQVYVLKIDPNGASLIYSTLIGAGTVANIALDSSGDAWVAGTTSSNYYPVVQPIESSLQQNYYPESADAFVTLLNPRGIPTFSTYLGGMLALQPAPAWQRITAAMFMWSARWGGLTMIRLISLS